MRFSHQKKKIINHSPCPICSSVGYFLKYHIRGYEIIECVSCKLQKTKLDPSIFYLKKIYNSDYFTNKDTKIVGYSDYFALERVIRNESRKRLRNISKFKMHDTLLDIGCGPGFFLDESSKAGYQVTGIDPSKQAISFIDKKCNFPAHLGLFEELKINQNFDIITAWDVIEHTKDPNIFLEKVSNHLNPNGILAISTGDSNSLMAAISQQRWHLYSPPEHLFYFTIGNMETLLKNHGFKVLKVSKPIQHFPLSYALERILFGMLHYPSKDILSVITKFQKLTIPIPIRDIFEIYATNK